MEKNRIFMAEDPSPDGRQPVLGMLSFPMQDWGSVYDDSAALARGTLFPALDLPYIGRKDRT